MFRTIHESHIRIGRYELIGMSTPDPWEKTFKIDQVFTYTNGRKAEECADADLEVVWV